MFSYSSISTASKREASPEALAAVERKKPRDVATSEGQLSVEGMIGEDSVNKFDSISNEDLADEHVILSDGEHGCDDIGGNSNIQMEHAIYRNQYPMNMYPASSLLAFLMTNYSLGILSTKVENDARLTKMVERIYLSLKEVVERGEPAATLGTRVRELFESPAFIQAFVETHAEAPFLIAFIDAYSIVAQDKERVELLKRDSFFTDISRPTEIRGDMSGVLSIVFGYWSDNHVYQKLREEIDKAGTETLRTDLIINVDFPHTAQGLKDVLHTKYEGNVYKRMCEEIDSLECYKKDRGRIKWLSVLWLEDEFCLDAIGGDDLPYHVRASSTPIPCSDEIGCVEGSSGGSVLRENLVLMS